MGAETVAKLKGYIKPKEIIEYIRKTYDKEVCYGISVKDYGDISKHSNINNVYDDSNIMKVESGYITFSINDGNQRSIFYHHQNVNTECNIARYEEIGLGEMARSEITELRLSADEEAIDILTNILHMYGGWLDENDCDDKDFYPVSKN